MRKFAVLGTWHVHTEGYAREVNGLYGCQVTKVWDEDPAKAEAFAKEFGLESASLEDILADEEIWGLIITCSTREHANVTLKAVQSGKAVFTEKVLTIRTEDALRIRDAALKSGARFAISFPHLCQSSIRFALEAVKSGLLGQINYARVRNVHDGAVSAWLPEHFYDPIPTGGGAMMDLGAHPMYLLNAFLGMPKRVRSVFTHVTGKAVEDNAVCLLEYENGAIGVSETGFVSVACPYQVELGGDKGTLLIEGRTVRYATKETKGQFVEAQLPDPLAAPIEIWALSQKDEDIPPFLGMEGAVSLTRIMELAYENA